jgi:hypothetical protein
VITTDSSIHAWIRAVVGVSERGILGCFGVGDKSAMVSVGRGIVLIN